MLRHSTCMLDACEWVSNMLNFLHYNNWNQWRIIQDHNRWSYKVESKQQIWKKTLQNKQWTPSLMIPKTTRKRLDLICLTCWNVVVNKICAESGHRVRERSERRAREINNWKTIFRTKFARLFANMLVCLRTEIWFLILIDESNWYRWNPSRTWCIYLSRYDYIYILFWVPFFVEWVSLAI